jgi:glycosyltransferase involved in cell wall biosynthesis
MYGSASDDNIVLSHRSTRVTILTNFWKGSKGGGIRTFLIGFVSGLREEDITPLVLFREGQDPENIGLGRNKALFMVRALLALRRERPDVVISLSYWFCLLPGLMYKWVSGTPLICSVHTVADSPSFLNRRMMSRLFRMCDGVAFTTRYMESQTRRVYRTEPRKTIITGAGLAPPDISDKELREFKAGFGLTDDKVVLLGHGLLNHRVKYEGVKRLILAFRSLGDTYPNAVLLLTGDGSYRDDLKRYAAENGVSDRVIFTGNLDNPYVAVKACDIFTHITMDEALSMAVLEAMAMGKPIVASAVGGIPEILDDSNGILVGNEPDQIAAAIGRFISDPEAARLKGEAAERDSQRFTWRRTVQAYESLFGKGDESPSKARTRSF